MGDDDVSKLFAAIRQQDVNACRELIAAGADVNGIYNGDTPLIEAVWSRGVEIAELLLERGASLGASGNLGRMPLHRAAELARLELCELFLAHGADLQARAARGETPLHLAATPTRGIKVCELLLSKGAKIKTATYEGDLPVHYAAAYGTPDACRLFAGLGFGPSYAPPSPVRNYLTPFQRAVRSGNIRTASFFIREFKEDVAQRSLAGRTLIQLAGKDNRDMKAFLRSVKTEISIVDAIARREGENTKPSARKSASVSPL